MFASRAGTNLVDESRWNDGLEPTTLGPVVRSRATLGNQRSNRNGGMLNDGDGFDGFHAEKHRQKLHKVKIEIDHWVDKEFEMRVQESRSAIRIKNRI